MPPASAGPAPWYPLAFLRDLAVERPQRITVHDRGFVVFRAAEAWQVLPDRCPHRAARLSDGEIRDGRLHCLYHGWQFGAGGRCLHVPQWLAERKIPDKAHLEALPVRQEQGILWLQLEPSADVSLEPPTLPGLDLPGSVSVDFMIDLPYAQSFLVENVIDIAHIHVAHHGVRGGGHRDLAAPLEFEVSERTAQGFSASFRSVGLDLEATSAPLRGARVSFVAPHLVHYESLYEDPDLCSGLALYSLPLGRDRCRLLYRAYNNFPRLRDRLRPRWLEHWTQCTILEQDMDVVLGQVEEILGSGRPPRELWLPLKSSDALVVAYRKWLDEHATGERVGFDHLHGAPRTARERGAPEAFDRLPMHTAICSSCSRARRRLLAAQAPLAWASFGLLAAAAAGGGAPAAALAVTAAAARLLVDRLERGFRGRGHGRGHGGHG